MRRALLALAVLAAGCTTEDAPALRTAEPGAQRGGVLRVATTQPGSVDPGNAYEPVSELIARTLCTPLLASDPATGEVVPSIASSYIVSDGGATVTLRLRDDVVFSDGTELTAEDVAFTLSRVASADYASTAAERLAPVLGYAQIHGDVATEEDLDRRRLRGVEVGDGTVQITLVEPLADFVRVLTSPLLSPVSEAAATRDPKAFARRPVCVGPYVLAEAYEPGATGLALVRSAAYTAVDSGFTDGGRGYAGEIRFRFHGDAAAAAAAVVAGEADVAPATEDGPLVRSGPGPMVEYLGLPTGAPGFEDARVRRAVALAVDREELVRRLFRGSREPADGFLPRTSEGDDACPGLPAGGDAEAARALLREAGAELSGVRVPLYFNDELRNRELVAELARQLRDAVGLVAVPTALTFDQLVARGTGPQGLDGMFRFSWSVPHTDVDGYLHPLFSTDRIGRDNFSRFSDPALDRALDRLAREAEDEQDRALGYRQVTDLLCAQMPMVPLTTSLSRWVVGEAVGSAAGTVVDGSTGRLMLRELYLR